jgi:hypothetical protein
MQKTASPQGVAASVARLRQGRFLALVVLLLPVAACSLLLNTSGDQCGSDGDCKKLSAGATCQSGVCVDGVGGGEGGTGDGSVPPGDGSAKDGGPGNVSGFDGCFPGVPKTPDELLNACTTASCVTFDNCTKLGLCNDGGLPAAVTPEAGAAPGVDAGPNPAIEYCADPALRPNVVYVTGSTNLPSFLAAVAPILAANSPPYTIVWQATNSCTGVDSQFNSDVAKRVIKDAPGKQTFYYDATGNAVPCWLGNATDNPLTGGIPVPYASATVDVGESDVFASSCATKLKYMPDPMVNGVGEYLGPVQAMTFLVPSASTQESISAEAAHILSTG